MPDIKALPSFGGKLKTPAYYAVIDGAIQLLRPESSLRTIADHLNKADLQTPSGLIWSRERVANYLRNKSF